VISSKALTQEMLLGAITEQLSTKLLENNSNFQTNVMWENLNVHSKSYWNVLNSWRTPLGEVSKLVGLVKLTSVINERSHGPLLYKRVM